MTTNRRRFFNQMWNMRIDSVWRTLIHFRFREVIEKIRLSLCKRQAFSLLIRIRTKKIAALQNEYLELKK